MTAPHRGTIEVYLTKAGYDPAQPLSWADLDLEHPVATATDPVAAGGFYTFSGTLPQRSGRQLLYAIWQRSDSPEAFYSCSDVTFGAGAGAGGGAGAGAGGGAEEGAGSGASSSASTPSEEQIEDGADESTVGHAGHAEAEAGASPGAPSATSAGAPAPQPEAAGAAVNLAETGGTSGTPYLVVGGAGALALGATALFLSVRRRAVGGGGQHGR